MKITLLAAAMLSATSVYAGDLIEFQSGTPAKASEVNQNFTELENRISNVQLIAGPKGDTGNIGSQGAQGEVGPKGDKGDTGDIGPQGPQGEVGATGPQGPAGADGADGADNSTEVFANSSDITNMKATIDLLLNQVDVPILQRAPLIHRFHVSSR